MSAHHTTASGPTILPDTLAELCDAIDAASWAYRVAADRMEAAARARQRGMALPGEDDLFEAETAAGYRRADLFVALLAWPASSPTDMARKLRLAAEELPDPGDDTEVTLAKVAMAEAAVMLSALAAVKVGAA